MCNARKCAIGKEDSAKYILNYVGMRKSLHYAVIEILLLFLLVCLSFLSLSEGEQSAVGRIKGVVNNVMLPNLVLKANITRRKSNITEVSCSIKGLPGPMVNWFKYVVPITAPVYWAGSSGQPGSQNGLERTQGLFNFSTRIGYPNGEYLSIDHTGRGLNEQGALVIDVSVRGRTPNFPQNSKVSFQDYKDFYIQTGRGKISSTGTRFFNVNNKRLQYLCNNTVRYKPAAAGPPRSLSQTVEVMEVDVNDAPDKAALEIKMKTFVKRSTWKALLFLLTASLLQVY